MTWLAILLLVPLVYVLISVFDVQRGAFGVSAASRAAGRAYALADTEAEGRSQARAAARTALADQGFDGALRPRHLVRATAAPLPLAGLGDHRRWSGPQVDLPLAPAALGGGAPSFRVDSTHRVPYGTYVEER